MCSDPPHPTAPWPREKQGESLEANHALSITKPRVETDTERANGEKAHNSPQGSHCSRCVQILQFVSDILQNIISSRIASDIFKILEEFRVRFFSFVIFSRERKNQDHKKYWVSVMRTRVINKCIFFKENRA